MSYADFETSQESGDPVELYEFAAGAAVFRYTSAQTDYEFASSTYEAIPVSHDNVAAKADDPSADRLQVHLPGDNVFARRFVASLPGTRVTFTLKRVHRSDPDQESRVLFKGAVRSVAFTKEGREAVLNCASLSSAFTRSIPRFTYSGLCNHMLYDERCKIDKDDPDFAFTGEVSDVTGKTITVDGAGAFGVLADFFVTGYIEFADDFRMVVSQSGDVMTLIMPFDQSPLGEEVVIRAGCKKRLAEDCRDKFDNVVNYGGFAYVPKKNPFETGID